MLYFAYGSNLSTLRLQKRVRSAQLVTTGSLLKHKLLFHKIGRDGSAKCNAFYTGLDDDRLYGAVYKIDPDHKILLDQAEGLGRGYDTKHVTITVDNGRLMDAFTYYATRIASGILPFNWYRDHVLTGAREHCFPEHYIEQITAIRVEQDEDQQRTDNELAIYGSSREQF